MILLKTTSINILNLSVPCNNHCKYCLLSWDGNCLGIADERAMNYAKRFYSWLKKKRPEMNFVYYFGYSMEHPKLFEVIDFLQETNSPGGKFLQFDGMNMRSNDELEELFIQLKNKGIQLIDFTFYGMEAYHDKFAGRKNDFDLMMRSLRIALDKGLQVEVGIPVIKDNINQIDELISILPQEEIRIFLFTPHSNGRGIHLADSKITANDYENMSDVCKKLLNRDKNRTPLEWLNASFKEVEHRILTLSLLPSNIDKLENQEFDKTILELERMDEAYYQVIPSFRELLRMYANEKDNHLYTQKDLYIQYRRRYIEENHLDIIDLTDERFSGSIRY